MTYFLQKVRLYGIISLSFCRPGAHYSIEPAKHKSGPAQVGRLQAKRAHTLAKI